VQARRQTNTHILAHVHEQTHTNVLELAIISIYNYLFSLTAIPENYPAVSIFSIMDSGKRQFMIRRSSSLSLKTCDDAAELISPLREKLAKIKDLNHTKQKQKK